MLNAKNVTKKFKQKLVLDDISLEFKKSKTTGLLGNNGAGKTTLLKIIFQEYRCDSGEILFEGKKMTRVDYQKMFFFTENTELPKNMSVEEYLEYILNLNSLKLKNSTAIEKYKWVFNFEKFRKSKIEKLSDGEKKMLSLFVLFNLSPELICFDEPTANLDFKNKDIMIRAIKYLKDLGKTIVIITHLISEVEKLLDEVIVFRDKKIIFQNSLEKIDNLQKTYEDLVRQTDEEFLKERFG
ncbi:ATP-binding cassette domain-containing protein [Spiroplasma alleghenense]|uniref:Iron complex transport system ATP-binding protein n=1 Tax=Spiroplasma alleghenense TaxID=216931 RepID=A0A345Z2N0_9MOLU|nr:ABC transporter ATP-binding protein [Spiroplasma alleghenense]AXK50859.1 iron complex transport system ATP-binding protein [Spiroplasma alleghenense]